MARQTMKDFIAANGITGKATWTDSNPSMPDFRGDHWRMAFARTDEDGKRRRLSVVFSKGYGLNGKPATVEEVMTCIVGDLSYSDMDEDEFLRELGYTDEKNGRKVYRATCKLAARVRAFLGDLADEACTVRSDD